MAIHPYQKKAQTTEESRLVPVALPSACAPGKGFVLSNPEVEKTSQEDDCRELCMVRPAVPDMRTVRMVERHVEVLDKAIDTRGSREAEIEIQAARIQRALSPMPLQHLQRNQEQPNHVALASDETVLVRLRAVSGLPALVSAVGSRMGVLNITRAKS